MDNVFKTRSFVNFNHYNIQSLLKVNKPFHQVIIKLTERDVARMS